MHTLVAEEERIECALADLPEIEGVVVDEKSALRGLLIPFGRDHEHLALGAMDLDSGAFLLQLDDGGMPQVLGATDCDLLQYVTGDFSVNGELAIGMDIFLLLDVSLNARKQSLEHVVDRTRRSPIHPIHRRFVLDHHVANITPELRQGKKRGAVSPLLVTIVYNSLFLLSVSL